MGFQENKYGLTCHTNTEKCPHIDVFIVLCFEVYFERNVSLVHKIFNLQSYSLFLDVFPLNTAYPRPGNYTEVL